MQELGDDDEVLAEVEVVEEAEDGDDAERVAPRDISQDANLAQPLVEGVLVVAQHFDGDLAVGDQVAAAADLRGARGAGWGWDGGASRGRAPGDVRVGGGRVLWWVEWKGRALEKEPRPTTARIS